MVVAKKYVLLKPSEGLPKESDFMIKTEELPPLGPNEYLVEAVYIGVDPYMRALMDALPINSTMPAGQVAKIIESNNPEFPVGKYVVGEFGWATHTIPKEGSQDFFKLGYPTILLPDLGDLPLSLGIGILGMPGNTAYFGFFDVCNPKSGETVVITAAAGTVGSHVGQLAKIKGCKVIGITGSDEKVKWLTKELGFDFAINYKTENVSDHLKQVAPEGVDIFFDNVGGEINSTIIFQMNEGGRVCVCGSVSSYNDKEPPKVTSTQMAIVKKRLRIEGIFIPIFADRWMEGIEQNLKWIKEGKLKYRETVTEGFENMVKALVGVFDDTKFGKAVVKV